MVSHGTPQLRNIIFFQWLILNGRFPHLKQSIISNSQDRLVLMLVLCLGILESHKGLDFCL